MEADEIKKILKKSFSPYRCDVEIPGFEDRMKFRVLNEKNETIISSREITLGMRFNHTSLESIISSAKKEIKKKGYSID